MGLGRCEGERCKVAKMWDLRLSECEVERMQG